MKLENTAPAKINLALHVIGRRADGYHLLESLVAFTAFGDRLSVRPSDREHFEVTGPFRDGLEGGANLVLKARDILRLHFGAQAKSPVAITLEKNLPIAAGIGGGSSDAAAVLKLLTRLWEIQVPPKELAQIGLMLGADVPMCLYGRPLIARGIGEMLEPFPALPRLPILLVNAGLPLATPKVFSALIKREHAPLPALPSKSDPAELLEWMRLTRNDLEPAALSLVPEIGSVLGLLRAEGALIARMSGSGATCFGIFEHQEAAERTRQAIAQKHPYWFVCATETSASTGELVHV